MISRLIVSLVMAGAPAVALALEITPGQIKRATAHDGYQAALSKFFPCDAYKGSAYEQIATGKREWVALAKAMIKRGDACYTEGIQAALGAAMIVAPSSVLPLVDSSPLLGADRICLPFISDELPKDEQLAALNKSRQAIAGVRKHQKQRQACLIFIDGILKR